MPGPTGTCPMCVEARGAPTTDRAHVLWHASQLALTWGLVVGSNGFHANRGDGHEEHEGEAQQLGAGNHGGR